MHWLSELEPTAFWTVVSGIVALAGAAGGVFSFALNRLLAWRNRPEADWSIELFALFPVYSGREAALKNPQVEVNGRLANTGDAAAHDVRMSLSGTRVAFITGPRSSNTGAVPTEPYRPLMMMGDSSRISATVPYPQDWDSLVVTLTWIASPTRLKKRQTQTFRLADYATRPFLDEHDYGEGKRICIDPLTGEEVDPPEER